jgi:hypothetical protein
LLRVRLVWTGEKTDGKSSLPSRDSMKKEVELSSTLEFLRPVFTTWVDRVAIISREFPQRERQYYLEPTLVGLLAGAAWSNGMQALTEVKVRRRSLNDKTVGGRLDLLIRSSEGTLAMESKIVWRHEFNQADVANYLDDAEREVRSLEGTDTDLRLGAVFFVPWWRSKSERARLAPNVLEPLATTRVDLKAVCYDTDAEFPGAVLLARQVCSC